MSQVAHRLEHLLKGSGLKYGCEIGWFSFIVNIHTLLGAIYGCSWVLVAERSSCDRTIWSTQLRLFTTGVIQTLLVANLQFPRSFPDIHELSFLDAITLMSLRTHRVKYFLKIILRLCYLNTKRMSQPILIIHSQRSVHIKSWYTGFCCNSWSIEDAWLTFETWTLYLHTRMLWVQR